MIIKVEMENGKNVNVNLEREELIYGITALLCNEDIEEGVMAINPITKDKMEIIKSKETRFFIPAHIEEDYEYAIKNNMNIKQVVAPYFEGVGKEKVRKNIETQDRHSVIAIIKHNIEDKYLCIDCKNRNCKSFVLGGIEKNETAKEAAIREVQEETGYQNIKINYISPISIYNHFYAGYKGVNRYAVLDIVFGEIIDEERKKLSQEENAKHEVKWINREDLTGFININNNLFALKILLEGDKAWEKEEGRMINSYEMDKMDIFEARKKIRGEENG